MTCVFEIFQSHCHILEELHEFSLFIYLFLCMMGASKTIFWEGSFVFSFIKL